MAKKTPVMSMKSYFGHLLGASGIAEIVAILSCMEKGVYLPTRGLSEESLDPECDVVQHIFSAYPADIEVVLCNSFGFGGTNASLVFQKYSA